MTGTDEPFKYKAMAAQIVSAEGMGNLLPVVEKELLHYRILDAMMREGFFSSLVFQGGTSLRPCHESPRYSEEIVFLCSGICLLSSNINRNNKNEGN